VYGYEASGSGTTREHSARDLSNAPPTGVAASLCRETERVALDAIAPWLPRLVPHRRARRPLRLPTSVELNPLPGIIPDPAMRRQTHVAVVAEDRDGELRSGR